LITAKDVADILGCKHKTVYGMLKDGTIPAYKIGGSVRFKRDQVLEWLQKNSNQAN
jgi:excisionase family DNA binding protein